MSLCFAWNRRQSWIGGQGRGVTEPWTHGRGLTSCFGNNDNSNLVETGRLGRHKADLIVPSPQYLGSTRMLHYPNTGSI